MSRKLISKKFEQVPLGLSGLTLGTIGLGFGWEALLTHFELGSSNPQNYKIATLVVLSLLVLLSLLYGTIVGVKYLTNKKQFVGYLRTPNQSGLVFPFFMALGLFGNFLGYLNVNYFQANFIFSIVVNIIVVFSTLCHVLCLIFFINVVLAKHDLEKDEVYTSWNIPLVGLAISCAFYPNLGINNPYYLAYYQILWLICSFFFIGSYFLFGYKQLFKGFANKKDLGSMSIMASPPNLLLVGFLQVFNPILHQRALLINFSITGFNIVIYALIFFSMVGLFIFFLTAIKLLVMRDFSFSWAAFTFSGAINVRSFLDTIAQDSIPNSMYYILLGISFGLISIVSLIVSFLTIKTFLNFNKWFEYETKVHTSGMV
ncbi:permease [Mycoplasma tullyi]|uniref:Permease n=1 Tax=Mycoplasma tullyi TaxID=1612150 RepID=A0A7D7YKG2_9MOLU|nr:permease [Mycoplasma tullyi]QMT98302.1 permease [Mycoplasma tullyi]